MKNPLNKSLFREFKNNIAKYLSIGIVMTVMISMVSGFLSVVYSSKDLLYKNQEECKVENGNFALNNEINLSLKNKLEELPLDVYENFYVEESLNNEKTIRIYENRKNINLQTIVEGKIPTTKQEIALERLFAEKNHYKLGDYIQIGNKSLNIVGFISVPDYTSLIEKNSDLMMDPINFGVAIVNNNYLKEFHQGNITYNYSYILNNRNSSEKESYDELLEIRDICLSEGYILKNMMTKEMNQAISFLPNDMGSDVPLITLFLYTILTILTFIFIVIIQSIIDEESTVIGALLSNGYTKYELMKHYMTLPIITIVTSSILGNIIGYTLLPPLFKKMYYGSYSLPPFELKFIPEAFISTTVIPFLIMFCIIFITLNSKLNISPLRFLRRDLKKKKSKKYISLRGESFFSNFKIRIIIENLGNYIVLFIGIIFASFIFIFGSVMTPSINNYLNEAESSIKANYQYILKTPIEIDNGEKFSFSSLETYYKAGNLNLDVSFYGLEENSEYYRNINLPSSKEDIVVSCDLANKMSLNIGDEIKFNNPYTDKEFYFTIKDIYDYKAGFSAYMTRENLNSLLEADPSYFNGYFSNNELDIDEGVVSSFISRNNVRKIGEQMIDTFSQLIPIMSIASIVIYLVIMYILTKLIIDNNATYMSFFKVMGYTDKEVQKLYLNSTSIIVIISLLISLPLSSIGLKRLMKYAFMQFTGYLEAYIPLYLLVITFLVGILTYSIVYFILSRQINKIDLGKALKNME